MKEVFLVYETNAEDGPSVFAVCATEEKAQAVVTVQSNANWFSKFYYESWIVEG